MPQSSGIQHVISRRGPKRRHPIAPVRHGGANPAAPGQIPSGLSNPVGSIFEPGRTIWKFITPPAGLHFDGGAIVGTARLVPLFWGLFWQTATNPSVADVHQAIAEILRRPTSPR